MVRRDGEFHGGNFFRRRAIVSRIIHGRTLMRALTVAPGTANSAQVDDIPEPPRSDGAVLVRTLALGVCGTDREIVSGSYGWAPPGETRLLSGHESFGGREGGPACGGLEA